ncbi:TIGR02449 family protein [Halioxenophilus aromaticivorans]|uniref:TIGR02449 family protein n=1 Tax=Halioxenophilus aromaticivorans TaxID=1306992 RepID=A0AAV3U4Y9_9ALTE
MSATADFTKALAAIENKLDALLEERQALLQENQALKHAEQRWLQERTSLVEKNELARGRIEAMIARLKSLESDA